MVGHAGIDSAIDMQVLQSTAGLKQLVYTVLVVFIESIKFLLQHLAAVHAIVSDFGALESEGLTNVVKALLVVAKRHGILVEIGQVVPRDAL